MLGDDYYNQQSELIVDGNQYNLVETLRIRFMNVAACYLLPVFQTSKTSQL